MDLSFDTISKMATKLKETKPNGAFVFNPADYETVKQEAHELLKGDTASVFKDGFCGLSAFVQEHLPRGEVMIFDTIERAMKFMAAVDRLRLEGRPWQLAIMEVAKNPDEPREGDRKTIQGKESEYVDGRWLVARPVH